MDEEVFQAAPLNDLAIEAFCFFKKSECKKGEHVCLEVDRGAGTLILRSCLSDQADTWCNSSLLLLLG